MNDGLMIVQKVRIMISFLNFSEKTFHSSSLASCFFLICSSCALACGQPWAARAFNSSTVGGFGIASSCALA